VNLIFEHSAGVHSGVCGSRRTGFGKHPDQGQFRFRRHNIAEITGHSEKDAETITGKHNTMSSTAVEKIETRTKIVYQTLREGGQ